VRIVLVQRAVGADDQFAAGAELAPPAVQRLRELERTVLDALGVEAAIGGEVDVLEEHAIHRRRDRWTGTREVERHDISSRAWRLASGNRRESREDGGNDAAPRTVSELR
jgi:hypothetical protein